MGTTPVIRVKGMSRLQYVFQWDKDCRHYAYEPKDQRETDDIFRTQGRLYKRMFFSVLMDEPKEEPKKAPKKTPNKVTKKKKVEKEPFDFTSEVLSKHEVLQAVEEESATD